jgi:ribosomal protein S18 acetylase RimI-like enzyme
MGLALNIRPARESEAEQLTAFAMRSKAHWGYAAQTLDGWRTQLAISAAHMSECPTFVAVIGDDIAGFYCVRPHPAAWELDALWVSPDFMRRGVGRALLEHALDTAREGGATELTIDADPNAERFYLACGAVRCGEVAAPIDEDPERTRPQLAFHLTR